MTTIMHLVLSKDKTWEIKYSDGSTTQRLAHGEDWDLGKTIAKNYSDKYKPDQYTVITPDFLDSIGEMMKYTVPKKAK